MQFGAWGMHRYGAKPHKQDAMDFWVAHVRALLPHIHEQQRACRADPQRILPTALVTFKTRRAQVGTLHGLLRSGLNCPGGILRKMRVDTSFAYVPGACMLCKPGTSQWGPECGVASL